MTNCKHRSFRLRDFDKGVLWMGSHNALGEILIRSVEFRGLVDQMKQAEGVELEEVDDWFVVLKPNVVRKLFESFPEELVLFLLEYIAYVELLQFLVCEVDEELF